MPRFTASLAACGLLSATPAFAQTTYEWTQPVDGIWSDATAWSPSAVPGQVTLLDSVRLGNLGAYTVVHGVPFSIVQNVALPNALAVLELPPGRLMQVQNALSGPGSVALVGSENLPDTKLLLAAGARIGSIVELRPPPGVPWFRLPVIEGPSGTLSPAVITPDGVVRGVGRITGRIINQGDIIADAPDHDILITSDGPLASTGRIVAANGKVRLASGLDGGGVVGSPDARVSTGNASVRNARLTGVFVVPAGLRFGLGPGNVYESEFVVHDGSYDGFCMLEPEDGVTLRGTVRLSAPIGQPGLAQLKAPFDVGASATLGADAVLSGNGQVFGRMVNLGTIRADEPGHVLSITTVGPLQSQGTIAASNGGTVDLSAGLAGGTLTGDAHGRVRSGAAGVSDAALAGTLVVGAFNDLFLGRGNQYTGEIVVHDRASPGPSTLRLADAAAAGGIITLNAPRGEEGRSRIAGPTQGAATLGPGSVLRGSGRLTGRLLGSAGTVAPGTVDEPGRIDVATQVPFVLSGTASFTLNGTAPAEHDRLTGQGTIELGGACRADLTPGYEPAFGDAWDLITGGDLTGSFASFDLPDAPPGRAFRVFYAPQRATLLLTCAADFDGDYQVNFFDVSAFIDLFSAQDPRADLAAPPGVLNFFDLAAFIDAFKNGCD